MYENEYMYAIERDPAYLAHYGIKGMKWGVRKAIERGNDRALGRQYRKAQKKLAKLEKRAANGKKYARRAAALGAGAAVAGGLAAAGTAGVSNILNKGGRAGGRIMREGGTRLLNASNRLGKAAGNVGNLIQQKGHLSGNARQVEFGKRFQLAGSRLSVAGRNAGKGMQRAGVGMTRAGATSGLAVAKWGKSTSIGNAAADKLRSASFNGSRIPGVRKFGDKYLRGISNNTIARVGAGAVGAGLAGAAGYNAYRAATTKRAAKKAAQFRSEMNKAFKGTKYANGGGNRQGKKRRRRG